METQISETLQAVPILTDEKRANLTRLLETLKSGEYTHTSGRLRSPVNGYCCLGVMCNLVKPDAWQSQIDPYSENPNEIKDWKFELGTFAADDDHTSFPAEDIAIEFGFADKQGSLRGKDGDVGLYVNDSCFASLSEVNDDFTSFDPVIQILEKYLADPSVESIEIEYDRYEEDSNDVD